MPLQRAESIHASAKGSSSATSGVAACRSGSPKLATTSATPRRLAMASPFPAPFPMVSELVAGAGEDIHRRVGVGQLGLLQEEDVRLRPLEPPGDLLQPDAQRHVPRGDAHRSRLSGLRSAPDVGTAAEQILQIGGVDKRSVAPRRALEGGHRRRRSNRPS
jgi:hypothetical protein